MSSTRSAGGEALLVLGLGTQGIRWHSLTDPAFCVRASACASGEKVLVFDPVAGGDALLVLDIGKSVQALAVFKEPATSAPRRRAAVAMGRCASSTLFPAATRCWCSTLAFP